MIVLEMGVLLRLLLAHVVCDFMLQSSQLVSKRFSNSKSTRVKANLRHSLLHCFLSLVFLCEYLINENAIMIIGSVGLLTVFHFLIDLIKSSVTNKDRKSVV